MRNFVVFRVYDGDPRILTKAWIPGKGFAAVPPGVTFESRFEAWMFHAVSVCQILAKSPLDPCH